VSSLSSLVFYLFHCNTISAFSRAGGRHQRREHFRPAHSQLHPLGVPPRHDHLATGAGVGGGSPLAYTFSFFIFENKTTSFMICALRFTHTPVFFLLTHCFFGFVCILGSRVRRVGLSGRVSDLLAAGLYGGASGGALPATGAAGSTCAQRERETEREELQRDGASDGLCYGFIFPLVFRSISSSWLISIYHEGSVFFYNFPFFSFLL